MAIENNDSIKAKNAAQNNINLYCDFYVGNCTNNTDTSKFNLDTESGILEDINDSLYVFRTNNCLVLNHKNGTIKECSQYKKDAGK